MTSPRHYFGSTIEVEDSIVFKKYSREKSKIDCQAKQNQLDFNFMVS